MAVWVTHRVPTATFAAAVSAATPVFAVSAAGESLGLLPEQPPRAPSMASTTIARTAVVTFLTFTVSSSL
jgi:hypothetical protein